MIFAGALTMNEINTYHRVVYKVHTQEMVENLLENESVGKFSLGANSAYFELEEDAVLFALRNELA